MKLVRIYLDVEVKYCAGASNLNLIKFCKLPHLVVGIGVTKTFLFVFGVAFVIYVLVVLAVVFESSNSDILLSFLWFLSLSKSNFKYHLISSKNFTRSPPNLSIYS